MLRMKLKDKNKVRLSLYLFEAPSALQLDSMTNTETVYFSNDLKYKRRNEGKDSEI